MPVDLAEARAAKVDAGRSLQPGLPQTQAAPPLIHSRRCFRHPPSISRQISSKSSRIAIWSVATTWAQTVKSDERDPNPGPG